MKYFKKLVGQRVYLSPMNVEDAEQYVKWLSDLSTTDGLGSSKNLLSVPAEKEWILENSDKYQFAIVRLADDVLLGNCGFHQLNHISQNAEVGLFIGDEENRSKGYGTEVLGLLLDYGFNYLNLHNIMLKVFSFNERAIHTYEKMGFREIGRRRSSSYVGGKFHDDVFMDILKEEFLARQPAGRRG